MRNAAAGSWRVMDTEPRSVEKCNEGFLHFGLWVVLIAAQVCVVKGALRVLQRHFHVPVRVTSNICRRACRHASFSCTFCLFLAHRLGSGNWPRWWRSCSRPWRCRWPLAIRTVRFCCCWVRCSLCRAGRPCGQIAPRWCWRWPCWAWRFCGLHCQIRVRTGGVSIAR